MPSIVYKVKRIVTRISGYRISLFAANASFYIILSIFPAIMLILGLLPHLGFSEADLIDAVSGVVPSVIEPLLIYVIHDLKGSSGVISFSALVAIWSSSRGVYCIQVGLNAICGRRESRSYLRMRLTSVIYMVFLLLALLLTLALHVFGQQLYAFCIRQSVPILLFLARLLQFRGFILLLLLSVLFTAVLCVFPNRHIALRRAVPGAVAAALGWLIFSALFSFYIQRFSRYSVFYGSLSMIAVGMLWLYVCISILFYGGLLNLCLERRRQ